jgi:hypothetical protein
MTNRVSYAPQDFEKKCKQAERDHESRKLALLLDRVKQQIADRDNPDVDGPKRPLTAVSEMPRRSALFER